MNQSSMDSNGAAVNYLNTFLACTDYLPDDLQKLVSQLADLEMQTKEILAKVAAYNSGIMPTSASNESATGKKKSPIQELTENLVRVKEMGDQKLSLVAKIIEKIEEQSKQLDIDLENLDPGSTSLNATREELQSTMTQSKTQSNPVSSASFAECLPSTSSATGDATITSSTSTKPTSSEDITETPVSGKRQWRRRQCAQPPQTVQAAVSSTPVIEEKKSKDEKQKKKKLKKDKTEKKNSSPLGKVPIDPNEPKYCICNQVSYGEMIGCDNEDCPEEWFHFGCVNLEKKPKGKWYCPKCRTERSAMRKDKAT